MSEHCDLSSRLLLVFAAVFLLITCSDAARGASPTETQVDPGVKYTFLRRLHSSHHQYPLFSGLPSTKTGIQTGADSEHELNTGYRQWLSFTGDQSDPLRFYNGSFIYNHNIPQDRQSEVRPDGNLFTSRSQHRGQTQETSQIRANDPPLSQGVTQRRKSVIIRKSSNKEAAIPFHQTSHTSQVWVIKDFHKSFHGEKAPGNDSPKMADHETVWQPSGSSHFPSQTYWTGSLPTAREHYGDYKETNELAAVGPSSKSGGIQSSKVLSFASQITPRPPLITSRLDASVIKHRQSQEKLSSSAADFSQGLNSMSSSETQRHKRLRSYQRKDSETSSGGQEAADGNMVLHERQPSEPFQGESPAEGNQNLEGENEANLNYANANDVNANVVRHGAPMDNLGKYQHRTTPDGPMSEHPFRSNTTESSGPSARADLQMQSAAGSQVNKATPESVHANKPEQTTRRIYGFRGFKSPVWRNAKEPNILSTGGSNERTTSHRYSFDKIANIFPSLSPKYSFGQREASPEPAERDRTPTDDPLSSPGSLDIIKTSGFKEAQPESDARADINPDHRRLRIYRRKYGLKAFGTGPLEGAKALVEEPDKSARAQQGFEGWKFKSSQIWQPRSSRIHSDPGSSHQSSRSEQSTEDLKTPVKTEEITPDRHTKKGGIGNAANKTDWRYEESAPESHGISPTFLRSAGNLNVDSKRSEPVALKVNLPRSSTSSTVRGKRVKGKPSSGRSFTDSTSVSSDAGSLEMGSQPKQPCRFKGVTHADVVGSASFIGVRARTTTPITSGQDCSPETTVDTEQEAEGGDWSINSEGPEAHVEDEGEDSRSVNKLGIRGQDVDADLNALLDDGGSGRGLNMSAVFSAETTSQELNEDLLELDYLRVSTENISFKSMKLSYTDP